MYMRMSVGSWNDVLRFINSLRAAYQHSEDYRTTITQEDYARLCTFRSRELEEPDRIAAAELQNTLCNKHGEEAFLTAPLCKEAWCITFSFFHRVDIRFLEDGKDWVQYWVNTGQFDFEREAYPFVEFLLDLLRWRRFDTRLDVSPFSVSMTQKSGSEAVLTAVDPKTDSPPVPVQVCLADYAADVLRIAMTGYREQMGVGPERVSLLL